MCVCTKKRQRYVTENWVFRNQHSVKLHFLFLNRHLYKYTIVQVLLLDFKLVPGPSLPIRRLLFYFPPIIRLVFVCDILVAIVTNRMSFKQISLQIGKNSTQCIRIQFTCMYELSVDHRFSFNCIKKISLKNVHRASFFLLPIQRIGFLFNIT